MKIPLDPDEQLLDRRRRGRCLFLLVEELCLWISFRKGIWLVDRILLRMAAVSCLRNPEPGSRWNCTWSINLLSTACDTFRCRPSRKGNKKPDFPLPQEVYHDTEFPVEKNLALLAVTRLPVRIAGVREILNEADKNQRQVHLYIP